jgi:hypothetical protein
MISISVAFVTCVLCHVFSSQLIFTFAEGVVYDPNTTYPNNHSASDLCVPIFDEFGNLHTGRSLYHCASVMQDPYMAITSVDQYADQNLTVVSDIVLNNLIQMNELENYVSIDLYFRLRWQDIRWVSLQTLYNGHDPPRDRMSHANIH